MRAVIAGARSLRGLAVIAALLPLTASVALWVRSHLDADFVLWERHDLSARDVWRHQHDTLVSMDGSVVLRRMVVKVALEPGAAEDLRENLPEGTFLWTSAPPEELARAAWLRRTMAGGALGFNAWRDGPAADESETGRSVVFVAMPIWSIVAVTALPALLLGIAPLRYRRRRLRRLAGRCPRCDYDLRATPDRCPECGWTAVSGSTATHSIADQAPAVNVGRSIANMKPC
jgi:hypothetical protein